MWRVANCYIRVTLLYFTALAAEHPAGTEYSVCLSCCRYTYGQPVRGRAAISVSIQPYSKYDRSQYGSKLYNVEVSMTATSAAYLQLFVTGGIAYTRQDAGAAFREVYCLAGRHVAQVKVRRRAYVVSSTNRNLQMPYIIIIIVTGIFKVA